MQLGEGEEGAIVVNQTPFYGESGGQVGDTGTIESENGARFRVTDTQKKADGLFVHFGKVEVGGFVPGAGGAARRSTARRRDAIRANHSATHLLHEALRADARHACGAEGLAGRAGPAALRLLASEADVGGRDRGGRGAWPTRSCCRMRRSRRG